MLYKIDNILQNIHHIRSEFTSSSIDLSQIVTIGDTNKYNIQVHRWLSAVTRERKT